MPKPNKGEHKDEFISRCIPKLIKDEKYPQKQAIAICYSYWKDKDKRKMEGVFCESSEHGSLYYRSGKPIAMYVKDLRKLYVLTEYMTSYQTMADACEAKGVTVVGV